MTQYYLKYMNPNMLKYLYIGKERTEGDTLKDITFFDSLDDIYINGI